MTGYIYKITNLINQKCYIGQTINEIKNRFRQHISDAKCKKDSTYLHKSMKKYGEDAFIIEEILSINLDNRKDLKDELNFWEKYFINFYNTLSPNGYNLTKGGSNDGEYLKRKVDEYDLSGNYIKTHDSILEAARSVGLENSSTIWHCCCGKTKSAHKRIWKYHGELLDKNNLPNYKIEFKNNNMLPVNQYSTQGELIQTFNSISEANTFLGKPESSHISECCNGNLYTAYGYVWRYKGETFDKYPTMDKRYTKCNKLDMNGNLINMYSSIQAACLSIGKDPKIANSNISACCKGKKKSAYGFKWAYA